MNASDLLDPPAGASGTPPLIGLTTYLEQASTGVWNVPAAFLPKVYFDAITRAGGIAVLLPPQPVTAGIVARVLDALDGLVITGGKDIEPARYGQHAHPLTDEPRPDRDAWEDALLRGALERDLPFLGICRGAQVLNVTLGGTLHQHLPDLVGDTRYQAGHGIFNTVDVAVQPGSLLSGLVGDAALTVPVYHHQAIDRLADGLSVTGTSDPGIVQAVELSTATFAVAVQWHPEEAQGDLRLFSGLVAAADGRRTASASTANPVTATPSAPEGSIQP
ncbi:gamma-glutamyl-gamma-aminobutyrate hydrolase family protein [Cryobacterium sp. SO2]|uniref:gamma-glutamyl-gamma-aminobutyrate hydrolase family protein n=1 Tax=Cryobacterium sp. SO2 TaxID=1897060 RepID=UPI00223D683B|nr:gamma-glutamyl-gamma-aminobutyrate hydrolase family protein [Cryobacterium sp. SO2]WEO78561.1 gamma-glutamyl-gamma-aminobutyrate hydrolase family protein [Cryobacterium sp. SO2]